MIRLEEILSAEQVAMMEAAVGIPPDTIDYSALCAGDES